MYEIAETERQSRTVERSYHCEYRARVRAGEDYSIEGYKRAERAGRFSAGGNTVRRGCSRLRRE